MTSSIRLCLNMGPQVAVLNWDNDQPEDFLGSPLSNKPTWRIYIPPLRVIPRNSHLSVYAWLGVWYPLGSPYTLQCRQTWPGHLWTKWENILFYVFISISIFYTNIYMYIVNINIYMGKSSNNIGHRWIFQLARFDNPRNYNPSTFWTLRPEMQLAILPLGHLHGG